jgi:hypothetical protein
MTEIKPIFIIRLNKDTSPEIRTSVFANMNLEMPDLFLQYHVIFTSGDNKHIEFECYNIDDIPKEVRDQTVNIINNIITKQNNENV